MISHRTMLLLAAAWLLTSTPQAFAQTDAAPVADLRAAGSTQSSTRRPTKVRTKHTATTHPLAARSLPAGAEPIDPAAERAASLERRRKAFFANKPDDGEPASDSSSAPVGVTLGGSGGLTPEMGLKF